MMLDDYPAHARQLAYWLELMFGDALGDDEIEEAVEDMHRQWSASPERAREVQAAWLEVLNDENKEVARKLVRDNANQGDLSPEEAHQQLKLWFDQFQPLWDTL